MRDKQVLFSGLAGVVGAVVLLLVIIGISDRPVFSPPCPEGVFRDGVRTGPSCVGGMMSVPLIAMLVAAGVITTSLAWWLLERRKGRAHDIVGA